MGRIVGQGLCQLVISVCCITGISFALLFFGVGDPLAALYGDGVDPGQAVQAEALRDAHGLDRPVLEQYGLWLKNLVSGNFGTSYVTGESVLTMLGERMGATLLLTVPAIVLGYLLAVLVGVFMAEREGGLRNRVLHGILFTIWSIPSFLSGILALAVFSVWLGWLPAGGLAPLGEEFSLPDSLPYLVLPLGLLTIYQAARLAGVVRSQMCTELASDYIRLARAAGLSAWTIRLYALRCALLPLITSAAMALPRLFAGAVMIETIFAWPGMGRLLLLSAYQRDYPVLMAAVLGISLLTVCGSFLADVCYRAVDPRIRRTWKEGAA